MFIEILRLFYEGSRLRGTGGYRAPSEVQNRAVIFASLVARILLTAAALGLVASCVALWIRLDGRLPALVLAGMALVAMIASLTLIAIWKFPLQTRRTLILLSLLLVIVSIPVFLALLSITAGFKGLVEVAVNYFPMAVLLDLLMSVFGRRFIQHAAYLDYYRKYDYWPEEESSF